MINIFTGEDIILNIITKIDDRFIETISGKLGSGKIGWARCLCYYW